MTVEIWTRLIVAFADEQVTFEGFLEEKGIRKVSVDVSQQQLILVDELQ